MKKVLHNRLLIFILGFIISGSVVYAVTFSSSDVTYDNTKSHLKDSNNNDVDNVKDAIDALYSKVNSIDLTKVGPNIESGDTNATHKGIAYLDPTDLSKTCNKSNSVSTTGTKEGCMKWYIFNNSGSNYKMILDHNTTPLICWNNSNSNVSYENSNLKNSVDDLVNTNHWQVTPRIITVDEINSITGKTGFNASSNNSKYYFDTLSDTAPTFTTIKKSYFDWLYNRTGGCTSYGCTIGDSNSYEYVNDNLSDNGAVPGVTYAYWAYNTVGNAQSGIYVWCVYNEGRLRARQASNMNTGIRPVIEVPKSTFN